MDNASDDAETLHDDDYDYDEQDARRFAAMCGVWVCPVEAGLKDTIDGIAGLLPKLGSTIQGELSTAETMTESKYWDNLQDKWREEIDSLRDTFEKASSAAIMEKGGNCKGTS